ncbi:helix-turn-helix transcriptional regulator [Lysinibacillus sp. M3]|uniref:Helix-turn-helix transcriptional regulator n=1 Tax=Lysinibacillus zambalensis TaxID=3160866 RepID=A0ABV1MN83_9BACI
MTTLDRVKELCKGRGINVKSLEERLDIPNNTIYQWKRIAPSLDKIQKVADYFDVSIDYLLCRTDNKNLIEDNPVHTIAAHHDGEEWTDEELEEIEQFKRFVAMRREARKHRGE